MADHGYGLPGTVLLCSDSHTCSAGVFNLAARGGGAPDMAYAVAKGETWFRVSETIRYELCGALRPSVSAKDVFLHLANTHGDHATMNVEYGGPALAGLSMNARRTISTMSAELNVEFATFEPDQIMIDHVQARTDAPFEPVWPDTNADYADKRVIDLNLIEPLMALPDAVLNNARAVGDVAGTGIDQAFIGSCANGTLDDLSVAARVLAGRRVADGTRLVVTPATQSIYRAAMAEDISRLLSRRGASSPMPPAGLAAAAAWGCWAPAKSASPPQPGISRAAWAMRRQGFTWPRRPPSRPPPVPASLPRPWIISHERSF